MLFSIIVPIYNVSRYIERGLACLKAQTFKDFEIILVDDGSTDNSGTLCDAAAVCDNRVRTIHIANSGAGPARNAGIEIAQGRYILFYDIDDVLHCDALEALSRYIEVSSPDMLVFSYKEIDVAYKTSNQYVFNRAQYNSNKELADGWTETLSGLRFNNGFVWNKVYKREFLFKNNIRFEALRIQQDEVFNLVAYQYAKSVVVIQDILYDYYVYTSGNTRSRVIDNRLDIYRRVDDAYRSLMRFWSLDDNRMTLFLQRRLFNGLIVHISNDICHNSRKDKRTERIAAVMNDCDIITLANSMKNISGVGFKYLYIKAIQAKSPSMFIWVMRVDRVIAALKLRIRQLLTV